MPGLSQAEIPKQSIILRNQSIYPRQKREISCDVPFSSFPNTEDKHLALLPKLQEEDLLLHRKAHIRITIKAFNWTLSSLVWFRSQLRNSAYGLQKPSMVQSPAQWKVKKKVLYCSLPLLESCFFSK